jgi:hypothetical protein
MQTGEDIQQQVKQLSLAVCDSHAGDERTVRASGGFRIAGSSG